MIKRHFICKNDRWKTLISMPDAIALQVSVGFLSIDPERLVYIYTEMHQNSICQASMFIESKNVENSLNYLIPPEDVETLFTEICQKPTIFITRYPYATQSIFGLNRQNWYLNIYGGLNEGLIINTVEVESKESPLESPEWCGEEITGDPLYSHAALTLNPFKSRNSTKLHNILNIHRLMVFSTEEAG